MQGIEIGRLMVIPAVTAYANDVTVFLTFPSDVRHLQDAILCYERATGARVNINKSIVVVLGPWNKGLSVFNIPYHDTVTILGMEIRNTLRDANIASWNKVTALIKVQTMEDYARDLNLSQRIHYAHAYLYACAWHISQIHVTPE
jgi:hypothetical protein